MSCGRGNPCWGTWPVDRQGAVPFRLGPGTKLTGRSPLPRTRLGFFSVSEGGPDGVEVLVGELDGACAFADGGRDSFGGSAACVAGGEHAGHAGFHWERQPAGGPAGGQLAAGAKVGPGEQEAGRVLGEGAGQPAGVRPGADEDEQRAGWDLLGAVRRGVVQG
jgi:hypothetical protein